MRDDALSCDDGDACNGTEECSDGNCIAGTPPICTDDGNPCTNDASCHSTFGCNWPDDFLSCEDGDVCNGGETCSGGACQAGISLTCSDDGIPCTNDACHSTLGCNWPDDSLDCSDGDPCRAPDYCSSGTCQPGPAVDLCGDGQINCGDGCDDGNLLNGDACSDACEITEFPVNTYITDNQFAPSVAMAQDGRFVISWASVGQDGDGWGVYAQRFGADGTPAGSEFQVNTYTTDLQFIPSVAMAQDGRFVITWVSVGQDGDRRGIYAQRYDSSGTADGAEFRVNTYIVNDQDYPSVAIAQDGRFVITWNSYSQDGDSGGIYAQRYDSSGTPDGSEFPVNTYTTNNQYHPTVAMVQDGRFVITWQSDGQDGDGHGVYAQRYAADGTTDGSEFQVNTYTTFSQFDPTVAMAQDGRFAITWYGYGDGDTTGIYAQRYDSNGTPDGSEFQVNTYTAGGQSNPGVALAGDGRFVITWNSDGQDTSGQGIYGQRYVAGGATTGSEFQVNTYTTNWQYYPSVAMAQDGRFVITWYSDGQDGDGDGIYAKLFPLFDAIP